LVRVICNSDQLILGGYFHGEPTFLLGKKGIGGGEGIRIIPNTTGPSYLKVSETYNQVIVVSFDWVTFYGGFVEKKAPVYNDEKLIAAVIAFAKALEAAAKAPLATNELFLVP
jgi:hypothetical protein